jgi:hypothetical protein
MLTFGLALLYSRKMTSTAIPAAMPISMLTIKHTTNVVNKVTRPGSARDEIHTIYYTLIYVYMIYNGLFCSKFSLNGFNFMSV